MKKILQCLILIPVIIAIVLAVKITLQGDFMLSDDEKVLQDFFGDIMNKNAIITSFYIYGTSLNIEGYVQGIEKDNYESMKIVLSNGNDFEKEFKVAASFEDKKLIFKTSENMNKAIIIDDLNEGKYFLKLKIKVNNSSNFKEYTFENLSENKNIEYYSLLNSEKSHNKIVSSFNKKIIKEREYSYFELDVKKTKLPDDIYDIVIDAGHGGTDTGNKGDNTNEANLMLEYAKKIKTELENKGYKVKLTRDDSNTDSFNYYNMYDEDGRISIACKTKAKYMLSLHLNDDGYSGIEVFSPNNSDLSLAKKIADNINNNSSLEYSTSNSFKVLDGVYVKNYTNSEIESFKETSLKKGIEPYNITTSTPYLYTIREVGGIATNAYVDGRNKDYSKNEYYNSNQGIECYQISLGSITKDINTLINEEDAIVKSIADSF